MTSVYFKEPAIHPPVDEPILTSFVKYLAEISTYNILSLYHFINFQLVNRKSNSYWTVPAHVLEQVKDRTG